MQNRKTLITVSIISLITLALALPKCAKAIHGTNIDGTTIELYTEQGDDWFLARQKKTDNRGVLTVKDVLPGKYKLKIDSDDEHDNQTVAAKLRMLDNDGRRINEKMNIDLFAYINDAKIFAGTVRSNSDGWIKVSGLSIGTEYLLDLDKESSLSKKDGELRIKTRAKIDESEWFEGVRKRTEKGVFEASNVLPGHYKFETDDSSNPTQFNLRARLLNEDGENVKKAKVKFYAYINGAKQFVGELITNKKGWVTIPGVMTDMEYKIDVKD